MHSPMNVKPQFRYVNSNITEEHTTAIFRVDVSALGANPYHMQVTREL